MPYRIRPVRSEDLPAVLQLTGAAGLPEAGIAAHIDSFWLAEDEDGPCGAVGLEVYPGAALLRSLVVAPRRRGNGLGAALVGRALDEVRARGAAGVYLLTTTAEHYFPRFGFAVVDRAAIPAAVTASAEFRGACPATAVAMGRSLAP